MICITAAQICVCAYTVSKAELIFASIFLYDGKMESVSVEGILCTD